MSGCELSIVVPARNEAANVPRLVEEIEGAMLGAGLDAELIVVDDASDDGTADALLKLAAGRPWLRVRRFPDARGQSAAMAAGIAAAEGRFIATMDADLQNDPGDLPAMLAILQQGNADLVQGDRSANRRDSWLRRRAADVGRLAQRLLLGERVRDTGCSARVMRASLARRLPLQYRGMHRFIPACARRMGAKIVEHPVAHRPRVAGTTNYGVGVLSRGLAGLIDCFAVGWMYRRLRETSAVEMTVPIAPASPAPGATASPSMGATASPEGEAVSGENHALTQPDPDTASPSEEAVALRRPISGRVAPLLGICLLLLTAGRALGQDDAAAFEIELSDRLADIEIEEGRVVVQTPAGPRVVAAEDYLRALEMRQRGRERGWLYQLFDITGGYGLAWIALGFAGQLLFMGRMLVQWIASERRRQSVVPPVFWWMSLAGASMLLAYFIWRKDVVGVFGQAMGWVIYARNLRLIYRATQ